MAISENFKNSKKFFLRLENNSFKIFQLYGPRWNSMMPKFASNLGYTPLEPQKSEVIPVQPNNSNNEVPQSQEVPDAKFDWNGSGLVNPLDCKYFLL